MSARTYVVGLPVLITVHDNGTVEWDIDRSEASDGIAENYPSRYDPPQPLDESIVAADIGRVTADVNRRAAT